MPGPSELLLTTERFRVERVTRSLPGGGQLERAVIRHPGSVAILPLLGGDRVCLIRNFRIAPGKTLLELPAGTCDRPESLLETARRELKEETGYTAERIEPLASFYVSPGIIDEQMHLFVARDLTEGPSSLEPGEEIHNEILSWQAAMAAVASGTIQDAKTIIGLLLHQHAMNS